MADKEERNSVRKNILIFIVIYILYSLFNTFIWEKYFYTPTSGDALENEEGRPGVMQEIDRKNEFAVLKPEGAFHVYIVANKLLGWEIEDDISLPFNKEKSEERPYTIHRNKMDLHRNQPVDTVMVITQDPNIRDVKVVDGDGNEQNTNTTHADDISLHYIWDEEGFDKNLTFKMYSSEDDLLYTE